MREILKHDKQEHTPLIIFSAYRADRSEETNKKAHTFAVEFLRVVGVPVGEGIGCYKGKQEQCIIAEVRNLLDTIHIVSLAENYEQESVLLLNGQREAALAYFESEELEILGKLVPISPTKAATLDAWTQTSDGQYYAVV